MYPHNCSWPMACCRCSLSTLFVLGPALCTPPSHLITFHASSHPLIRSSHHTYSSACTFTHRALTARLISPPSACIARTPRPLLVISACSCALEFGRWSLLRLLFFLSLGSPLFLSSRIHPSIHLLRIARPEQQAAIIHAPCAEFVYVYAVVVL